MSLSNLRTIRRAKPLLGTIVDIALHSELCDESALKALLQRCFQRVREVHDLMSFFDEASDIGRLNSAPAGTVVEVSQETADLLRFASSLHTESEGAFDVMYQGRASFPEASMLFHGERSVSCTAEAPIDLGGIAKGYAVDQVAAILRAEGGLSAVINAGGDIQFVGDDAFRLTLRSPLEDGRYFDAGSFSECAVATSVFNRESDPVSISVFASSCVVADSLTKCVHGMSESGKEDLLARYDARVIAIDAAQASRYEEFAR